MKAYYDKVGQCWRIRFGEQVVGIDGTYHWPNLCEMQIDLRYKKLAVNFQTHAIESL